MPLDETTAGGKFGLAPAKRGLSKLSLRFTLYVFNESHIDIKHDRLRLCGLSLHPAMHEILLQQTEYPLPECPGTACSPLVPGVVRV